MITVLTLVVWTIYFVFLYFIIFWLLTFVEYGVKDEIKEMKEYPYVTVGIPAYNEEETIIETLKSVINLDYPRNKLEIIVVNDGSKDKTEELVRREVSRNKGIKIILINQKNAGKGAALNKALKIAKGEYFVSMDSDSYIKSNALKAILPNFDGENVAAVLPLLKIRDPGNLLEKVQWAEYMVNLFYKRLMAILDCIQVTPGPFSVYRRLALEKVGGYDENNLTEDMEVTLKLQKAHYKIKQVTTTEVYTIPPSRFKDFYKQRNRWYKGTLLNAYKYKDMAFNREYGDFGFIQMPRLLVEGFLAVIALGILSYTTVFVPLRNKLHSYSLVNFDVFPLIGEYLKNFSFLDLDYINLTFSIAMGAVVIVLLYYAHKHTNEKFTKRSIIAIPLYLIFYSIFSSVALLGVFIDLLRGKKQKW